MTYVVTENCQDCVFTDCVEQCPVACFYIVEADRILYIHPDECIDCNACVPACPVEAIYADTDVPEDQEKWTELNVTQSQCDEAENITEQRDPLPTADAKKTELGL
ncbi:MAG: ferredoxin family protein [Candidatus Lindowbacteria bacterium]|nr:ferredoxin family protein [Candidatus Lindowbacteria bacterium]